MQVDAPPPSSVSGIISSIRHAAQATGASFNYLLATAKVESGLDPSAGAGSSSARGLFQFIEQTWLGMVKQAGGPLGLGRFADAISKTSGGGYQVADPQQRAEILKLRNDPAVSAAVAGVFTQNNAGDLAQHIGRTPSDGELYIAHFIGVGGASKLITLAQQQPDSNAAAAFPDAARANRSIFYDRQGNARSAAGVYQQLVGRYQAALAATSGVATPTAVAAASAVATPAPVVAASTADTAGVSMALADAAADQFPPVPRVKPGQDMFRELFQVPPDQAAPRLRGAVAPVVAALWSQPQSVLAAPASTTSVIPDPTLSTLDLFRDRLPGTHSLFDSKA